MNTDDRQAGDEKKDGVPQIEVTPKMARVGAQILENLYNALPSEAEGVAIEMFRTMMRETPEWTSPVCSHGYPTQQGRATKGKDNGN
jgi:hypothetical protein